MSDAAPAPDEFEAASISLEGVLVDVLGAPIVVGGSARPKVLGRGRRSRRAAADKADEKNQTGIVRATLAAAEDWLASHAVTIDRAESILAELRNGPDAVVNVGGSAYTSAHAAARAIVQDFYTGAWGWLKNPGSPLEFPGRKLDLNRIEAHWDQLTPFLRDIFLRDTREHAANTLPAILRRERIAVLTEGKLPPAEAIEKGKSGMQDELSLAVWAAIHEVESYVSYGACPLDLPDGHPLRTAMIRLRILCGELPNQTRTSWKHLLGWVKKGNNGRACHHASELANALRTEFAVSVAATTPAACTKPGYPKPPKERLTFASQRLAEVEQCIAPASAVLVSVLVCALLGRSCTTAEAMWAIFVQIEAGRYKAMPLGQLYAHEPTIRSIVSETNVPAGLNLAVGVLHIDGEAGDWGCLVVILPKRGADPLPTTNMSPPLAEMTAGGGTIKGGSDDKATQELDNQALEQILIGHMLAICGGANQIFRPVTMFDHGIDGEVEFRDDDGKASGKKIYVQLKSGGSYLRSRKRDDKEVFDIKNERHLEYWVNQPVDVYLVIQDATKTIRWMNVTRYLIERDDAISRQIVFDGEKLDVGALRRVRDEHLRRAAGRESAIQADSGPVGEVSGHATVRAAGTSVYTEKHGLGDKLTTEKVAHEELTDLRVELAAVNTEWCAVEERYRTPDAPHDQRASDECKQRIADRAAQVFMAVFAPLAERIVDALGKDAFPDGPKLPPERPQGQSSYNAARLHEAHFGVDHTLKAGFLLILWGATANSPSRFGQTRGAPEFIRDWSRRLIVETEQKPGLWRTLGQPMEWAESAFEASTTA